MTKKLKILNFISTVRNSFIGADEVYTCGSCFQFYLILKQVYPESKCYYNIDHVITKIDDTYYDIDGIVYDHKSYLPYSEYGKRIMKSQSKHKFSIYR